MVLALLGAGAGGFNPAHPAAVPPAHAAAAPATVVPLDRVLHADGTLDLSRGVRGAVDPTGWHLISAPGQPPRFAPAGAPPVSLDPAPHPNLPGDENWDARFGLAPLSGKVDALAVSGSDIYLGGQFRTAGGIVVNNVVRWNGSSWSALGSGVNGPVLALAVAGTDVYVGGYFTMAGGLPANNIARWNGSSWAALGNGVDSAVYVIAMFGGNVYAGGWFTTAGGVPAEGIARWNGSQWAALGSGLYLAPTVYALAVQGTDLYVGGDFYDAGGVPVDGLARWNGSSWSAVGNAPAGPILALAVQGTDLYAAGNTAGHIARWNGSSWTSLGSGVDGSVRTLAVFGTDLYAGGAFVTAGSVPAQHLARWNGSSWAALGSGVSYPPQILAAGSTALYVGGEFTIAGSLPVSFSAQWSGSAWAPIGAGLSGQGMDYWSQALAAAGADVYAGGGFFTSGPMVTNSTGHWNGSSWAPLGSGVGTTNSVYALAISGTNVYVGGSFSSAGGVPANNIARWNGTAWTALGSGLSGTVWTLAVRGSEVYAGGEITGAGGLPVNNIAQWNGTAWTALGGGLNGSPNGNIVRALAIQGSALYAGGVFTAAGGVPVHNVARWDGSAWTALGDGLTFPSGGNDYTQVRALAGDGTNLYAGGYFSRAGGLLANNIARWDGTIWTALDSGITIPAGGTLPVVNALVVSGADVYAGGEFTQAGPVPARNIARWNGSTWSNLGSGTNSIVMALTMSGPDLYVGGVFTLAGNSDASYIAAWHPATLPGGTPTATATPPIPATGTNTPAPLPAGTATITATQVPPTAFPTTTAPPTRTNVPGTATTTPTPCLIRFSDVHTGDYFATPVQYLACHGILSGYSDGTFRPYNATTRAQLAKIVVGAAGWPLVTPPTAHFRDVPPGSLFYTFVETAFAHGIVSGYSDGTFQPGNPVTRGQLAKIIVAAQGWPLVTPAPGHFRDVPPGYVFYSAIETAFAHGLISGYSDGTFRPGNPTTRGQIAKIVYGALPIP